jgi:hypothetical protein
MGNPWAGKVFQILWGIFPGIDKFSEFDENMNKKTDFAVIFP